MHVSSLSLTVSISKSLLSTCCAVLCCGRMIAEKREKELNQFGDFI